VTGFDDLERRMALKAELSAVVGADTAEGILGALNRKHKGDLTKIERDARRCLAAAEGSDG
jgi:hypothetical protein